MCVYGGRGGGICGCLKGESQFKGNVPLEVCVLSTDGMAEGRSRRAGK